MFIDIKEALKQHLENKLDRNVVDAWIKPRIIDNITVIFCSLKYTTERYFQELKNPKDIIVLFFNDHFGYNNLTNPNVNNHTSNIKPYTTLSRTLKDIIIVCEKFHNKKIILISENFFVEDEINLHASKPKNLYFVTAPIYIYGSECPYFKYNFQNINKSFTNNKHVMCLNNSPRPHRVGTVLYLIHKHLNKHTYLTFMTSEHWDKSNAYDVNTILSYIYPNSKLFIELQSISLEACFKSTADSSYKKLTFSSLSNPFENFDNFLREKYESTVVEIITETTAIENIALLTEKFIQCVFGMCFPIIIGTRKNVELYRTMGYDMFDDIIDHSYDYEPNPFYRMKMAIDLNIEILTNKKLALNLYYKNEDRLKANINNYHKQYRIALSNAIGDLDASIP